MTDLFSYLKDREKRLQQKKEAEILQAEMNTEAKLKADEAKKLAVDELNLKYDKMVTDLLTQLRDGVYSGQSVKGYGLLWKIYSVSYDHDYYAGISLGSTRTEESAVTVNLEINSNNKPVSFICKCGDKVVRTGLTSEELSKALIKLHP